MTASPATQSPSALGARTLAVALRTEADGPVVLCQPVTEGDLFDLYAEVWLATCLRKGHPEAPLDDLRVRLVPVLEKGHDSLCLGLIIEGVGPDGATARHAFPPAAFEEVAWRASQELIRAGQLKSGDLYFYDVVIDRRPVAELTLARSAASPAPFTVTARPTPLARLSVPLPPLVERAEAVGDVGEPWVPVFFTRAALEKAERFARRGALAPQPVETGCVLVGPLCSCPSTGEFFVVACEAIELLEAEGTEYSLTYSGATWAHVQATVRAVQAGPATHSYRIVGQAHGHNFPPHFGEKKCGECDQQPTCTLTSVFPSVADRRWTRAVFARQPWAICHIFGITARGGHAQALFGLRHGALAERGYYVLPDFAPPEAT
ncbi:MAG TPA: hypothetical protein VNE39_21500 [Planctomycetota bacterium]|nr:hypothetical protein [Planctomycetota bacterium]